jgi:hypothetical protein
MNGMGFALGDVPSTGIYRGDYQVVSDEQFAAEGSGACGATAVAGPFRWLGLFLVLVGVLAFAATLSRRTVLVLAGLTIVALAVTTLLAPVRQELVAGAREKASAFAPGSAEVPPGRTVIADLGPQSASVHEVAEGLFVARFLAPGDYAFMVDCSGRSLQVSESSEIPNGGTGSRELIGCANPDPVRSGIGSRPDRARLVEVVVLTNGAADWRVVVLDGAGIVGPFDQP